MFNWWRINVSIFIILILHMKESLIIDNNNEVLNRGHQGMSNLQLAFQSQTIQNLNLAYLTHGGCDEPSASWSLKAPDLRYLGL